MTFDMIPQKCEERECQNARTPERENTRKQDNKRNSRKKVESSQPAVYINCSENARPQKSDSSR